MNARIIPALAALIAVSVAAFWLLSRGPDEDADAVRRTDGGSPDQVQSDPLNGEGQERVDIDAPSESVAGDDADEHSETTDEGVAAAPPETHFHRVKALPESLRDIESSSHYNPQSLDLDSEARKELTNLARQLNREYAVIESRRYHAFDDWIELRERDGRYITLEPKGSTPKAPGAATRTKVRRDGRLFFAVYQGEYAPLDVAYQDQVVWSYKATQALQDFFIEKGK
jgi:hypothetical protein